MTYITRISGNWIKLKTKSFFLKGPVVSTIYVDLLSSLKIDETSGPFKQTLCF